MKLSTLALTIWILVLNSLCAQPDDQWYVLNKMPRNGIGYNSTALSSSNFQIAGISAPGSPYTWNGNNVIPQNNLFIIFDESKYILQDVGNSTLFSTPSMPSYLYFTNIYEEDDPPQAIVVSDITTSITPQLSYSQTSNLLTNHNLVRGKDVTLIIPYNIFRKIENSTLYPLTLEISPAIMTQCSGSLPVLRLQPVFENSSGTNKWSFQNISATTTLASPDYISSIDNIPFPGEGKYHFINFQVDSTYNPCLINSVVTITAKSNGTTISSINLKYTDLHDPNFIKVKCIYIKKKPWYLPFCNDRYFVKYYVQFFNDGPRTVNNVVVKFILPEIAISNSIKMDGWYYGGDFDCTTNNYSMDKNKLTQYGNNVSIDLSNAADSKLIEQGTDPMIVDQKQFGHFEFCVEVNQDPRNFALHSLQPLQPKTIFDGIEFPITRFIDPFDTIPCKDSAAIFSIVRPHTFQYNECNCSCIDNPKLPDSGSKY